MISKFFEFYLITGNGIAFHHRFQLDVDYFRARFLKEKVTLPLYMSFTGNRSGILAVDTTKSLPVHVKLSEHALEKLLLGETL